MPLFSYKAITPAGEAIEGEMEAADEAAVVRHLQDSGHIPVRAEPAGRRSMLRLNLRRGQRGLGAKEIASFTRDLATLLQAGLPLDRALQILTDLADDPRLENLISNLQEQVRGGATFSAALQEQGTTFSRLYINLVRAGEAGGALELVLERLSDYLERSRELRESVLSALIYPAILLTVAAVSVVMLLVYVIPQFTQLFEDMGQDLPLATQMVVGMGNFFRGYWWLLLLLVLGIVAYFRQQFGDPQKRYRWDRRILRIPMIGELVSKVEMARFSHTLSTLLGNGVPLLTALGIVKEILSNRVLAEGVETAADSLKQGRGLAEPMMETGVFPQLALQMMKVGEESGQLDSMLSKVAHVYDREVKTAIQRVLALLEPVLIVGLGVFVAGIIMSILVAVLSVNQLAF